MAANTSDFKLASGQNGIVLKTKSVCISEIYDSELAVFTVRDMALKAGFGQVCEFMIATAASELATNILRYAKKGILIVSLVKGIRIGIEGIELFACDEGPGIPDINKAMCEQYSSQVNSLGLGLPSIRNIMDDFFIESVLGSGTRILTYKWKYESFCD
jgi:serine/threonine-protein kinase RsbT